MTTIAVIGLGDVGLSGAVAFGKQFRTIGFRISKEMIADYFGFNDPTGEVSKEDRLLAMLQTSKYSARPRSDFCKMPWANGALADVRYQSDAAVLKAASVSVWRL